LAPGTVVVGASTSGRFSCRRVRFTDFLLGRSFQRRLIALLGGLQARHQLAQNTQCVNGYQRGAERVALAFGFEHPTRQRAKRSVRKLTEGAFATLVPHSPPNREGLAKQRMPAIVNRHRLKIMGTR
jgi:hypothetical protein